MARILMVASEVAPFAKTGGLADVLGALPKALSALGHDCRVLMPLYGEISRSGLRRVYDHLPLWLNGTHFDTAVWQADGTVPVYFLEADALFDREGLYGDSEGDYPDNHLRFAVFARAALEVVRRIFRPDILHCHDWQAGLIPAYIRGPLSLDPTFLAVRTLVTIHNLGYQGIFPGSVLPEIGLEPDQFTAEGVEFWGRVNYLKAGLVYADALSTVSRTYAREIQTPEYGFGLDGVLRARANNLTGILNGVDYTEWDPSVDSHIPANYSCDDLSGKKVCKRELLSQFGLPEAAMKQPLVGIVSRFTSQKGTDLIAAIGEELVKEDLSLVALGSGEPQYEAMFQDLVQLDPEKIGLRIGYNNGLSHLIEAGSDIFLMPSRYEPCGLSQIYSLRYGTIPVVRATGGLDDTIDEESGFKFNKYSGPDLLACLRSALAAYSDCDAWKTMMRHAMGRDFSWDVSAREYSRLYQHLLTPGALNP